MWYNVNNSFIGSQGNIMAVETVGIAITSSAYTLIGQNVTVLSFSEPSISRFKVVVVATGATAPASDTANYVIADSSFKYGPYDAVDVYVMSTGHDMTLGVIRA